MMQTRTRFSLRVIRVGVRTAMINWLTVSALLHRRLGVSLAQLTWPTPRLADPRDVGGSLADDCMERKHCGAPAPTRPAVAREW
jgi:hypothetical protein